MESSARPTYAVTWQEPSAGPYQGRLELGPESLVLEGRGQAGQTRRELLYRDIGSAHIGRSGEELLAGRPSLCFERPDGRWRLAAPFELGALAEILDLLARRRRPRSLVVSVPLQEGADDEALALLRQGPPFDLADVGVQHHTVCLLPGQALFQFELVDEEALERLAASPRLWEALAAWQPLIAGLPQVSLNVFHWDGAAYETPLGLGY